MKCCGVARYMYSVATPYSSKAHCATFKFGSHLFDYSRDPYFCFSFVNGITVELRVDEPLYN